jgi:hypothetical protein
MAFILKMSKEGDHDVQDKVRMTKVRELSFDMEGSIHDFMKRVDDMDTKPDGFIKKIKDSLAKIKSLSSAWHRDRIIEETNHRGWC